jgi:hypothetical protein
LIFRCTSFLSFYLWFWSMVFWGGSFVFKYLTWADKSIGFELIYLIAWGSLFFCFFESTCLPAMIASPVLLFLLLDYESYSWFNCLFGWENSIPLSALYSSIAFGSFSSKLFSYFGSNLISGTSTLYSLQVI